MLLAVDALAHVHGFRALLAAVDWRVACHTAGGCVWVGVGVLVESQFVWSNILWIEERDVPCSRACPGSTATALLACLLEYACFIVASPPSPRCGAEGAVGTRLHQTS